MNLSGSSSTIFTLWVDFAFKVQSRRANLTFSSLIFASIPETPTCERTKGELTATTGRDGFFHLNFNVLDFEEVLENFTKIERRAFLEKKTTHILSIFFLSYNQVCSWASGCCGNLLKPERREFGEKLTWKNSDEYIL